MSESEKIIRRWRNYLRKYPRSRVKRLSRSQYCRVLSHALELQKAAGQ